MIKQGQSRRVRQTAEHAARQAQEDRKAMFLPPNGSKRGGAGLRQSSSPNFSLAEFGRTTSLSIPGQRAAQRPPSGFRQGLGQQDIKSSRVIS